MADKTLIWHQTEVTNPGQRIGPTYYAEADYIPKAVRVHAVNAPTNGHLKFAIYDDGVSIFRNRGALEVSPFGGTRVVGDHKEGLLPKGQNKEDMAEDFPVDTTIKEGSWVHCVITDEAGARNITVQLELEKAM